MMTAESVVGAESEPATREGPTRERRQSIWAIAGGKGGAGRSLLAANLGVQLARSGRRVVLVDLDLQGSNLHSYLGYKRLPRTLGDFAAGRVAALSEVACETAAGQLRLIGGAQRGDLRDDPLAFVRHVVGQFSSLSADYVIVDCGSGRSPAAVAAFAESTMGVLVTTPEPTALESVYLFVEAHLRWCVTRALAGEVLATVEEKLKEAGHDPRRLPFRGFMSRLAEIDSAARDTIADVVRGTRLEVLLNQVRSPSDEEAAASLASGFRKCFGLPLHTVGTIEHDLSVLQSSQKRRSLSQQYPNAAATRAIAQAATRLFSISEGPNCEFEEEWVDLDSIDHYRVLEVAPRATPKEVQAAYQLLKRTFDPESTHLAPVLEAQGLRDTLARIEAAYRTLIFLESRATYDQQMRIDGLIGDEGTGSSGSPPPPGATPGDASAGTPLEVAGGVDLPPEQTSGGDDSSARGTLGAPAPAPQPAPRQIPSNGSELREARQKIGLTLEAIVEETKVRPSHLDAIEKERFADLPAPVFIRGFLREYSRCLGLPVDEVTRLYMQRYQDWRESGRHPGDSGLGSSSLS
jgi:flagellar biosynthesis protein FlhG